MWSKSCKTISTELLRVALGYAACNINIPNPSAERAAQLAHVRSHFCLQGAVMATFMRAQPLDGCVVELHDALDDKRKGLADRSSGCPCRCPEDFHSEPFIVCCDHFLATANRDWSGAITT